MWEKDEKYKYLPCNMVTINYKVSLWLRKHRVIKEANLKWEGKHNTYFQEDITGQKSLEQ